MTQDLISGLNSVESFLRQRLAGLEREIAGVEHETGLLIKRRERLYEERDKAQAALAAIDEELTPAT